MKPPACQHSFAIKACEILQKKHIPIAGYDKYGNPHVAPDYVQKLPKTLKPDLFKKGHWRVIIRSYQQ